MPRWLFKAICVLAFCAPVGAACLHAWPFVTGRPVPAVLDADAVLLSAISLLLSAGLIMLMSVSVRSDRSQSRRG
ncbi:hypothetical protein MPAR168_23440 [Methylorubrum populi]|uniref:Uncharacterized protein n=1 Tax=Methylobacterium radiotolerans TaxID=31998 RepID=A0ABU7TGV7_9HYPH